MTRIPPDVVSEEQLTALAAKAEKATAGPVVPPRVRVGGGGR